MCSGAPIATCRSGPEIGKAVPYDVSCRNELIVVLRHGTIYRRHQQAVTSSTAMHDMERQLLLFISAYGGCMSLPRRHDVLLANRLLSSRIGRVTTPMAKYVDRPIRDATMWEASAP